MFAIHLSEGSSLHCKTIKSHTIDRYLLNISKVCRAAHPTNRDPRKLPPSSPDKYSPDLKGIIAEIRRWETMPNRVEPLTPEMVDHAVHLATKSHPDSLIAAIAPWLDLGLYTGFRRIEWAQPSSKHANPSQPQTLESRDPTTGVLTPTTIPYAFLPTDWLFFDTHNNPIPLHLITTSACPIASKVRITFRYQKNGQHGETKEFLANRNHPLSSPTQAAESIIRRHARLTNSNNLIPLAVYRPSSNQPIRAITAQDITTTLRNLASTVHTITSPTALRRLTPHSLRVGACTLLHSQGISDSVIKHILRWRSDAFRDYLRNMPAYATSQNTARTNASSLRNH